MEPARQSPSLTARRLIRAGERAALATSFGDGGFPYASLVLAASDLDASPLLLISALAEHTKNLRRDARASLLYDATHGLDDPLTGARVTVLGEIAPDPEPSLKERFLRRHPSAQTYANFADFALYRMTIRRAHLVAGFGRIHWIDANDLVPAADASALRSIELSVLQHMNGDHAATVDLYAQQILHLSGSGWFLTGIDPEGADLRREGAVARLDFAAPVHNGDEVRRAFVALAQSARRDVSPH